MYKTKPQDNWNIITHFSGSLALFPVNNMPAILFIVPVLYRILREFGKVIYPNLHNGKILHKSKALDSG